MADLTHRDWVLYSQRLLCLKVNPNLSVQIVEEGDKRLLVISNISDRDLHALYFLVNTDQNNNYLYPELFEVTIADSPTPLHIPGLSQIMLNLYRYSDITTFVAGSAKTHAPFSLSSLNSLIAPCDTKITSWSEYIGKLSSMAPLGVRVAGKTLTYRLVLNPDLTQRQKEEE